MSVERDVLTSNYITKQFQEQMEKSKDQQLISIKNEIILSQLQKIEDDPTGQLLDEAIQSQYKRVSDYLERLQINDSIYDTLSLMEEQKTVNIPNKRKILSEKVAHYVKTVLQLLDITWSIIEEFKYKMEMNKNIEFDNYYTTLVDTLLIKVKILHISVLIATYEDQDFIKALESLKNLFEVRYLDAETNLLYISQQLKEYNDIGPEFKTLSTAYQNLLIQIQATKDDIQKIKNN